MTASQQRDLPAGQPIGWHGQAIARGCPRLRNGGLAITWPCFWRGAATFGESTAKRPRSDFSGIIALLRGRLTVPPLVGATFFLFLCATSFVAHAEQIAITGLDGHVTRGEVLTLAPEIRIATDAGEKAFGWSDLTDIRKVSTLTAPAKSEISESAAGDRWRLELGDGSRISAAFASSNSEGLAATTTWDATLSLKPSDLRYGLAPKATADAFNRIKETIAERDAVDDAILLMRGGELLVLRGTLRRMDGKGVTFTWKDRDLPVTWEKLIGLVVARPTPREASVLVRLVGGDALAGKITGGNGERIQLLSNAQDFELKWAQVESIEVRSSRVVFLSQLTPQSYEFRPFFSKRWDPMFDRTYSGQPIRVRGQEFARGVVMHSEARIIYMLGGAARQFAADAAILDEVGPRGDVTMKVVGDGRLLWEAKNVRGGEPARSLLVDVGSVMVLELLVEFGEGMDLSDQAVWANARVIR